jgi:hypothetical protein
MAVNREVGGFRSFAGAFADGEVAPKPAIPVILSNRCGSTSEAELRQAFVLLLHRQTALYSRNQSGP